MAEKSSANSFEILSDTSSDRDVLSGNTGHLGKPLGGAVEADLVLSPSELIVKHQHGVWRYLRMLGCDTATADDLTQETFLKVLRSRDFQQVSDAATSSYLRRTAYHLLVSFHRKMGRVKMVPDAQTIEQVWDRWAGKDLSGDKAIDALRQCLNELTERARLSLRMRFGRNSSRAEIAEALSISEHGARNLMQRAKQQLRECVEETLKWDRHEK